LPFSQLLRCGHLSSARVCAGAGVNCLSSPPVWQAAVCRHSLDGCAPRLREKETWRSLARLNLSWSRPFSPPDVMSPQITEEVSLEELANSHPADIVHVAANSAAHLSADFPKSTTQGHEVWYTTENVRWPLSKFNFLPPVTKVHDIE